MACSGLCTASEVRKTTLIVRAEIVFRAEIKFMMYHKTTQAVLKRAIRQTYFVSHLFLRKLGKVVVPMSTSTFWPLMLCLCRGCYGSSEAPGGLNILLEVPHKSIFSSGDKILANSDEWMFFGL